jgi:LacI family transcriptional regulator
VAKLAGVSYTTVSHVINGTRKVSEGARERVLQAVSDCGYVPSQVARSLKGAPTKVLGVLVPDISDPFCAEITLGVERVAALSAYSVVLANAHPGQALPRQALEGLLGRHIDGLLVVAGLFDHGDLLQRFEYDLQARTLPMVFIDHDLDPVRAHELMDEAQAQAGLAVNHLLAMGHTRVACVSGPMEMPVSQARVRGWRQALSAAGVSPEPGWLVAGDFGVASGFTSACQLLGPAGCKPSAVFACNDLMAIGVLRAAAHMGVHVPRQCSVIGMDGIVLGEYVYPALTTVGESLTELGARGAETLLRQLGERTLMPIQRLLRQARLICRESTGPCQLP